MHGRKKFIIALSLILLIVFILLSSSCASQKVVIGSKPFNEQYILAHMIALLLDEEGIEAEVQEGLGGSSINYEALKQGQIDAYVEYTGTAYSVILDLPQKKTWDPEIVYTESEAGMLNKDDIHIAVNIGFQDNYGIAVPRKWALQNSMSTISQLGGLAGQLTIGTDPEFATRPDGLPQLEEVYGITFGQTAQMEPTLMYEAIKNGNVDAISGYTTDTRIDRFELMFLEDDKNALIPYDAIVLVNRGLMENSQAMEALLKLENKIDTDTMRQLNYQYDVEQREAKDIARDYLLAQGLIN